MSVQLSNRVHQSNAKALVACGLPFHSTSHFVRLVQAAELEGHSVGVFEANAGIRRPIAKRDSCPEVSQGQGNLQLSFVID